MGSLVSETGHESTKEWNVLVTGFGPFSTSTINPSFLIASSLPDRLVSPYQPTINIHAHPTSIDVCYTTVRQLMPKLLFPKQASTGLLPGSPGASHRASIPRSPSSPRGDTPIHDVILHIGMAAGRKYYTLETLAHRDGYTSSDIDEETMSDDTFWRETLGAPEVLRPSFDVADVWRRWKSDLMDEDLQPSNDAGRYLCDFIYYTSMVEYWRRDPSGTRPCMFLHVPGEAGDEDIERGRNVTLGLIRALVSSELARRANEEEHEA